MGRTLHRSGQRDQAEPPLEEPVVAVVRAHSNWPDCRAIIELITPTQRLTPLEAHRLLAEQPGALYVTVRGRRLDLQPASDGPVRYVRTMEADCPTDALLALPVHAPQ